MSPLFNDGDIVFIKQKRRCSKNDDIVFKSNKYQLNMLKRILYISDLGIYVLGINKADSIDSRRFGYINANSIIGVVSSVSRKINNECRE